MTRGGEVVHESLLGLGPDGAPRHSTALLERVERAVEEAGGWRAVGLIAVGVGPGSFTGLRIGVATARALSGGLGLPARGVCTLDAVAAALRERSREKASLAILDARRGEIFSALYSPAGERLWGPRVDPPEALAERLAELPRPPLAGGAGAVRFRCELARSGVEVPEDADPVHRVAARHVCALAAAAGYGDSDGLEPIYLRPPDAERWRERDAFQREE